MNNVRLVVYEPEVFSRVSDFQIRSQEIMDENGYFMAGSVFQKEKDLLATFGTWFDAVLMSDRRANLRTLLFNYSPDRENDAVQTLKTDIATALQMYQGRGFDVEVAFVQSSSNGHVMFVIFPYSFGVT